MREGTSPARGMQRKRGRWWGDTSPNGSSRDLEQRRAALRQKVLESNFGQALQKGKNIREAEIRARGCRREPDNAGKRMVVESGA